MAATERDATRGVVFNGIVAGKVVTASIPQKCPACQGVQGLAPECPTCGGSGFAGVADRKVMIRQPTLGDRKKIIEAGKIGKDGSIADPIEMQLLSVMLCCYDPDSRKRLFDPVDRASLLESVPAGGWFDELATQVLAFTTPDSETLRKNSSGASAA